MRTLVQRTAIAVGIALVHVVPTLAQSGAVANAHRVISLVPSITDIALAIGGASNLIARTDYDRDVRLARLPSVGGPFTPNLEIIARLDPDLVITWDDSAAPGLALALRDLKLRSIAVRTSSLQDLRTDIRLLGMLFARRGSADSLWRSIDESLQSVQHQAPPAKRPRVFLLVWRRPLMTAGHPTLMDTLVTIAGGENVFHDAEQAWPIISIEALALRRVDVIVVPTSAEQSMRDVLADPSIARLLAIAHPRVVPIDADLLDRPGPRTGEAARALAAALR